MEIQQFFDFWTHVTYRDIDLGIFSNPGVIFFSIVLFFFLKQKTGSLKAILVVPLIILVETTIFNSMEYLDNSFVSTFSFVLVSGIFAIYLVYVFFFKDFSTSNRT